MALRTFSRLSYAWSCCSRISSGLCRGVEARFRIPSGWQVSANLLHCRSPFISCAQSASITWERTASRRRPAFSPHLLTTSISSSFPINRVSSALGDWFPSDTLEPLGRSSSLECVSHPVWEIPEMRSILTSLNYGFEFSRPGQSRNMTTRPPNQCGRNSRAHATSPRVRSRSIRKTIKGKKQA